MNSNRLPNKALTNISGIPLLQRVVNKISFSDRVSSIIVATSDRKSDDPIALFCKKNKVKCFRGNLNNVANRFKELLISQKANSFIRINGDSPLIDSNLINIAIDYFKVGTCDIVTNIFPRSFPKGQSVEVLKSETFIKVCNTNLNTEQKEHVTKIYYDFPEKFKILSFTSGGNYSNINMSIDNLFDKEKIESIINKLKDDNIGWKKLCQFY
tara:strand:+ start:1493 stop:2128 length:636 start_codon:yes stop_codon:yes gene_type:complete